jgi:hypothetical protein
MITEIKGGNPEMMADSTLLEVQLESLLDRGNVSLDDADLAERLLAVHDGSSGAPVPSGERAAA